MSAERYVGELLAEFEARISSYRPRLKGIRRSSFPALARNVVKRAGEHYLLEHAEGSWLEHTEQMLGFIQIRKPKQILVRVGAPASGGARSSLITTCMTDQPFIVDSIRLCLQNFGLDIRSQLNMILPIARSKEGGLRLIGDDDSDAPLESITQFEVSPIAAAERRLELEHELAERLRHVHAVTGDFPVMLGLLRQTIGEYEAMAAQRSAGREEIDEVRHFLEWIADDHFVFLGMILCDRRGKETARHGLARMANGATPPLEPEARDFLREVGGRDELIYVHRSTQESRVHRGGRIDEILVHRFDADGRFSGSLVIHGLFTYRAIQTRGGMVPLLRRKLEELVRLEDVREGTYNYKSIANAFNVLPVEYLFGASVPDIRQLIRLSLAAERSGRLDVHLSFGRSAKSVYVFVVMPRENFSEELRSRIQRRVAEALGANYSDGRVLVSNYGVAVLHYYFTTSANFTSVDPDEVERVVIELSASWQDRFRQVVLARLDRAQALELYRVYHAAFSQRYQISTDPEQALSDCLQLEALRADGRLRFDLYWDDEDSAQNSIKLRIYEGHNLKLSEVLPVLDQFGLIVINSFTNHVEIPDGNILYMDTFRCQMPEGIELREAAEKRRLLEAVEAVFDGRMASDGLNRVLLPAGLTWQQVDLLRSLQCFAKQLGNMFTPNTVWPTLVKHAGIVNQLIAYFEAKCGPQKGVVATKPSAARVRLCEERRRAVLEGIDAIESFSEDRMLRVFLNLIDAMLRTSYYKTNRPHASMAHKFDCAPIFSMADPKPWREIFVHHAELEGVHLRGGRIARGGLRWSDRNDDYRTEILGLMTTQMVKNVVIVPVGAKGGFVLRRPPSDAAERRVYADRMYEVFIHSLLDLADNVVGDTTLPPSEVVCWDDPDPYFVVAADKGTAHLSDTANRVSQSRGFWLGDAFASGGSNGYDHKALGITAKGAWVSMRHLLREMGLKPDSDMFTVVGIGDLGGDVFGNGMIEHANMKLLAAFNHRHIFLDPDPDPKLSHAERTRLFSAKYGGWDAYDSKKISRGGGVFERSAKRIELSAAVRKLLGTQAEALGGTEIVRLILQMPVDLLYNGGIGTYVKASTESHAAAADPSNDALRVDASEVRAKVVGEGGNLGFTQAARIEFAQRGGRINTDFIDNAGGVNCSDHEVNLKILLQPLVAAGRLREAARNKLLREVEPFIVTDVLAANADQALLLSLDERRSRINLAPFDDVIEEVCRRGQTKRSALALPSAREIARRMESGEGLTRPELAILSSYVKMQLYDDLVADSRIEFEGIKPALVNYFPDVMRRRYPAAIQAHRLGREIALTRLTNRIVDHTGITFFREMAADHDATPRQTFEAYSLLSRASGAWPLKDAVLALGDQAPIAAKYEALLTVETALRAGTQYLLEHWSGQRIVEHLRDTATYAAAIARLRASGIRHLDAVSRSHVEETIARLVTSEIPKSMAEDIALTRYLPRGLVILDTAEQLRRPAAEIGGAYFALGRRSGIFAVIRKIEEMRGEAYYDALALKAQKREMSELLRSLVIALRDVKGDADTKLASLGEGCRVFADLSSIPAEDFGPAALMVSIDRIRAVLRKQVQK